MAEKVVRTIPPMRFVARWRYGFPFSSRKLEDFLAVERDDCELVSRVHCYTYAAAPQLQVTLVPIVHRAHPQFFHQIDLLLRRHKSVLMEGRYGHAHHGLTTIPPRPLTEPDRPHGLDDTDGWEPQHLDDYLQPQSWGVAESPCDTVLHSADVFDSDNLPMVARLRFNLPLVGSRKREKNCVSMIPALYEQGYDTIAIPWGAMHMPTLHAMLIDNGFVEVGQTAIVVYRREDGEFSAAEVMRWSGLLWWRGFAKAAATMVLFAVVSVCNLWMVVSLAVE